MRRFALNFSAVFPLWERRKNGPRVPSNEEAPEGLRPGTSAAKSPTFETQRGWVAKVTIISALQEIR